MRYWTLVRINATGQHTIEEIARARAFFQQEFAEFTGQIEVPDTLIQWRLVQILRDKTGEEGRSANRDLADSCLRCFISHRIEQVCLQLEMQFGNQHGFTRTDLLRFTLDDVQVSKVSSHRTATQYRSLATEILQTFNPDRAELSTWTTRVVRHHRELEVFLLEHGVYLASDWAILNDTNPQQLQRILSEFYALTANEIQRSSHLLQAYHDVYRHDRLLQGQVKTRGQCLPPTSEQLHRMVDYLQQNGVLNYSPDNIMSYLQTMAKQLRQYRIYARSGVAPTKSLDQPETQAIAMSLQYDDADRTQDEQYEFLAVYRQQFLDALDQVVEQVTSDRITFLERKNSQTAEQFITALYLFHCLGQPMGEIASQLGFKAQYQVTRLLKLKEFHTDLRQRLLGILSDRILELAKPYVDANYLYTQLAGSREDRFWVTIELENDTVITLAPFTFNQDTGL